MMKNTFFGDKDSIDYNMLPINTNAKDDGKINLSKNYAKIILFEDYYQFKYDPTLIPSLCFKYKEKTKDEELLSFDDKLDKYLQDEINKRYENEDNPEFTLFDKDLQELLRGSPMYEIFLVFLDEQDKENRYKKLDRKTAKIKSYDWDYLSETWYKRKEEFQDSDPYDEFFSLAKNCYIVELKIYSEIDINKLFEVYLFIFDDIYENKEFLTQIMHSVFFSKQALGNYFYSYMIDMIFNFALPSSDLVSFYKNIGIMTNLNSVNSKINDQAIDFENLSTIFPFKEKFNKLEDIITKNMVSTLILEDCPFEEFVKTFNEYEEKNYSLELDTLNIGNKSLKSSCNSIKKELDIILKESLNYEKFFFFEIKKSIEKYISYKGCFNIDILLSNEDFENVNSKCDKLINCMRSVIKCFFKIFECNEGFIHKHIQMFDFSYSFNDRNVIHIFPSIEDNSQKNKIRIFDFLFREEWTSKIAALITLILNFQSNYYKKKSEMNIQIQFYLFSKKIISMMRRSIFEIFDDIIKEFFDDFPSFYEFCGGLYKFPIKKYNHIDYVCHHFANFSVKSLLKYNYVKFSYNVMNEMIDIMNDTNENCPIKNYFPKLEILYEDCFIIYDKEMDDYLHEYYSLDNYLYKFFKTVDDFINKLEEIDCEMSRYSLIALPLDKLPNLNTFSKNYLNIDLTTNREDLETFPYTMYFNLYHFHKFEIMKKIYLEISNYRKNLNKDIKQNILSYINDLIMKIKKLTFLVKNMTYKFYNCANYVRSRLDKNEIKFPSSFGHYLMEINSDQVIQETDFYKNNYILMKNKIIEFN